MNCLLKNTNLSAKRWAYVKKEISPIIEDYAQRAEFPEQIVKQLGDLGCFGPTIPAQYGGGGLDYISYGLMMQELERGDSGVTFNCFCAGFAGDVSDLCNMAVRNSGKNIYQNLPVANGLVVLD